MPFALSLGVSYQDFWELTPKSLKCISKGHQLKLEEQNRMNYIQGYYNYVAINSILPTIMSLGKEPPAKYLDKPIPLFEGEENEEDLQEEIEQTRLLLYAQLKEFSRK